MWWVHRLEGIPFISMYSQENSILCCFRNVTRHSKSSGARFRLIFSVIPSFISTGILFEFLSTGIILVSLTKVSFVIFFYFSSSRVLFRIWSTCLLKYVGSLMKLLIASSYVSSLKVKAFPIVNRGWTPSSSSSSIHSVVSASNLGRDGGYKVRLFFFNPIWNGHRP